RQRDFAGDRAATRGGGAQWHRRAPGACDVGGRRPARAVVAGSGEGERVPPAAERVQRAAQEGPRRRAVVVVVAAVLLVVTEGGPLRLARRRFGLPFEQPAFARDVGDASVFGDRRGGE